MRSQIDTLRYLFMNGSGRFSAGLPKATLFRNCIFTRHIQTNIFFLGGALIRLMVFN